MAGLGFKDFQVGEVLTSADVDGYLMQQAVMRFADSAARGSALGTATGAGTALAEGMVAYLDDVNQVQLFDGTSWRATSAVLQVVQSVKTTSFSTTSGTFVDITDMSVTITPSSTTSKVLVVLHGATSSSDVGGINTFQIVRDATAVFQGSTEQDGVGSIHVAFMYLDSPVTTSSVTYKAQMKRNAGTAYWGRTGGSALVYDSSITVMEVAA